ncbi:hypothetical protein L1987_58033 [Smallanthus sonchifolius]|uniref:Uncharacterized protein n=1 Tax=Smallanthus sonchifolius TaxID=185202 RepID=A0ACB9DEN4_9ASTR|nr:hypothetical protein L1987_58033 [Smallanthus sonchifolius]
MWKRETAKSVALLSQIISTVTPEPTDEEQAALKKKGKLLADEDKEVEKSHKKDPAAVVSDHNRIIPGTQMPTGMADEIAQRFHEEELKVAQEEENQRKIEVYRSKAASRQQEHKRISQKERDKAQRKDWKNELVASGKFHMKNLHSIKMSTPYEIVKHVRREMAKTQQRIILNLAPNVSP